MPLQKGRQQYLAIKRETTRLTAETSGFTYLPWTSLTAPGNENSYLMDESAYSNRGKLLNKVLQSQHAPVNWGGYIDSDNLLLPLLSIFGTATPTTALGATTWAISLNQDIESRTFTVQYNTNQTGHKRVAGWMSSKLDLEFGVDTNTYSVEGIGLQEVNGTSVTPSVATPNKYLLGRHITMGYATTLAGLSSATSITDVKTAKVSFDTGLDIERHKVVGSLAPTNISQDGFSSTFEFSMINNTAQTTVFRGFHDNGDARAFRLRVEATNLPVIGTSALRPTLQIDFPPSTVVAVREIPIDDYLMQTVTIEVSQPDLIAVTLINAISAV